MKKSTTFAGVVSETIVEEAWQQVGASFERFCLTVGIATLAGMMEGDADRLCGVRYGRDDGRVARPDCRPRHFWVESRRVAAGLFGCAR